MGCSSSSTREKDDGNKNNSTAINQQAYKVQENNQVNGQQTQFTNVIIVSYTGVLYDNNSYFKDKDISIITNNFELNEFKEVIAKKLIGNSSKSKADTYVEYYDNVSDAFLNGNYDCDFNYQNIIVICGAQAKQILKGDNIYNIVYSEESGFDNCYYAYVVKEKYLGFIVENSRPWPIEEQRPLNEDPNLIVNLQDEPEDNRPIIRVGTGYKDNYEVKEFIEDLISRGIIIEDHGIMDQGVRMFIGNTDKNIAYMSVEEVKEYLENNNINY